MSKPLILKKVGSKWEVYLDVPAARAYALRATPRMKKYNSDPLFANAIVPVVKTGPKSVDFIPGGKPHKFTKAEAKSMAHQIGYYMLDLGNFTYTYTEEIT